MNRKSESKKHPVLKTKERIDLKIRDIASNIGRCGPSSWSVKDLLNLEYLIHEFVQEYKTIQPA
jgi:hypothetical protein